MATKTQERAKRALKRRRRVRGKVFGTAAVPRMTVAKSLGHTYVQIVDDQQQVTLLGIGTNSKVMADKISAEDNKTAKAKKLGEAIAEMAVEKGITRVVFDRNRFRYHGRIKATAEGARAKGLKI